MPRRILLITLASLLASVAAIASADEGDDAAPPAEPEHHAPERNLATLVKLAEKRYPGLSAASHHIRAAEALLDEARIAPYLDGIAATGAFTVAPTARGNPVFSPDSQLPLSNPWGPSFAARIEGVVPLWTFGKLDAVRDVAVANVRGAHADRDRQLDQLRFDVRRAYFALGLSLDAQQMINEGKGKLTQAVSHLQERIDANDPDVNEVDRWRLASTLAEVEGRESEAERLRASSFAALGMLTGETDFEIPDCPLGLADAPLHSTRWYQDLAHAHRPELRMVAAGLFARQAQVDLATAGYFPDLAFAFSAGVTYTPGITDQQNPFVYDPANTPMLGGALIARWNLDFAGIRLRDVRAHEDLFELRDRSMEANRAVDLDVATIVEELRDARRREESWGRGHRETRAWFVSAAQAYEVGTNESRDLVDALRAYFLARYNHMQAILDANIATAKLERSVGAPLLPADHWETACE